MFDRFNPLFSVAKSHRRLAVAAAIASLTVLASGAGIPAPAPLGITISGAAWAQDTDISPEKIAGYAASVIQMDGPRNEAYSQIQTLLTGTGYEAGSIDMSCTGTDNLNQLPRNVRSSVRTIVVNYCNEASTIVQANGLTVRQFNAITAAHPQDPALAEQIRTAMIQLQQQSQDSPRPANGSPE